MRNPSLRQHQQAKRNSVPMRNNRTHYNTIAQFTPNR
jgi:hypothetical protein